MGHGTWDVFRDPACVAFPETVDFVLILVDSKCNFVTCEFVTLRRFDMYVGRKMRKEDEITNNK